MTYQTLLISLRFQNIALLNSQDLAFEQGFTVITGETGSGKSILIDSLDILLGGGQTSTSSRLMKSGTDSFLIEGVFSRSSDIEEWFNKNEIFIDEDEFVISREWRLKDGRLKSKCRINGIYINRSQINQLRLLLIDFTSQGFSQKINTSSMQIDSIDKFGFSSLELPLSKVKTSWIEWNKAFNKLQDIQSNYDNLKIKNKELEIILEDLEISNLEDPKEIIKLEEEQDRLANVVGLQNGFIALLSRLKFGSDDFPSTLDQISDSLHDLKSLSNIDKSLVKKYDNFFEIFNYFKEFIDSLDQYTLLLDSDPSRLNEIQIRLDLLKRLQNKYGLDLSELIHKRDELRESFFNTDINKSLLEARKNELIARKQRNKNNHTLSLLRQQQARYFEEKLIECLHSLGFVNLKFHVEIQTTEPNIKGSDSIKFLFSANPGQPLLPLDQVASGGEMSRFVLAMKTILSETDSSKIFVFDEIDSGVSGRVSQAIAMLLKELSQTSQVFCVTHQPLVAALAHHHISISKVVSNGQTSSKVRYLNKLSDRENELAELAGGDIKEAKLYAARLLDQQAA